MNTQESHNDNLMAEAFHRGEEKGLSYIHKSFFPALSLFAFKYVKSRTLAEEIVSEAFIKVWTKHWKLNSFPAIRAYLYKTVYRDSMHTIKKEQKREKLHKDSQSLTINQYTPFDFLVSSEIYRVIHNSLKDLPPGQREVIKMYYLEGKTSGQIAKELHLQSSTITTQKSRGLEALRKKLKEQGFLKFLVSKIKKRTFKVPLENRINNLLFFSSSKEYPYYKEIILFFINVIIQRYFFQVGLKSLGLRISPSKTKAS